MGEWFEVAGATMVPADVFKLLVRGGYPQTANEFWNEHFEYARMDDSHRGLDELGEMSRWIRGVLPPDNRADWAHGAEKTWIWIVAKRLDEYADFSNESDNEPCAAYRAKLMRAWDDSDGKILARAIACMNFDNSNVDTMVGKGEPNAVER
jgi:hypothetical protein